MKSYAKWIENWEMNLTLKDRNRRIFPFGWGLDWLEPGETDQRDPLRYLRNYANRAVARSQDFFTPPDLRGAELQDGVLTFETPLPSPVKNNNITHARLFRAADRYRAVVVVPQWNATKDSHVAICRVLQRMGITTLRLMMPYHETRLPDGMRRADFFVSPNLGRTLHATRQAVLEVRQLVRWLKEEGYKHVGVVGTSIGSCVTYLAFTHDPLIGTGVFNHVSSFFADVVWTGLSTRYVRWGLEGYIDLEDLRVCWSPLSPIFFVSRLSDANRPHLLITAKYDLTFLPKLSRQVIERYLKFGISFEKIELPCGHYTTARFPFKYLDGWHICRYLQKNLG